MGESVAGPRPASDWRRVNFGVWSAGWSVSASCDEAPAVVSGSSGSVCVVCGCEGDDAVVVSGAADGEFGLSVDISTSVADEDAGCSASFDGAEVFAAAAVVAMVLQY